MNSFIRIAHVTDIHIGEDTSLKNGVDVRKNFQIILKRICKASPDLIVLGGDQAYDAGETEAYLWLKKRLEESAIPYLMIAGNHDIPENLNRIFVLEQYIKNNELYYYTEVQGKTLFFLDSSSDSVSRAQLKWLLSEACSVKHEVLLFMHHPPVAGRCRFMDTRHPLKNREEVFQCFKKIPNIRNIICGHYHTEKTVTVEGKNIFLTPSTMLQIEEDSNGFNISSRLPGWRIIEWNGECLYTKAEYIY